MEASDTGKIKIQTKYRKLIDSNCINLDNKAISELVSDSEIVSKEEKEY